MECSSTRISYRNTGVFNPIVLDLLEGASSIKPFFPYPATVEGLQEVIRERAKLPINRKALVDHLRQQYKIVKTSAASEQNIELLLQDTSFTITTAHQPNLFTGPLYFIYKILHAIRLADSCKTLMPEYDFIPVYYMGSEDADLDELGHFNIRGQQYKWETNQKGAVGRMRVDKDLLKLLDTVEGQLLVEPHGESLLALIRLHFEEGRMIQDATFGLVNALFMELGLVVLVPDNGLLKKQMISIFRDDLFHQKASSLVETTTTQLKEAGYKVQANPREINLFYLEEGLRGRIEKNGDQYLVHDSDKVFSEAALINELESHPERFSPNVILRGLYQETILPNIVFVGGGGELAYWLQLKTLFEHYRVSYPVLILRNSFAIINRRTQEKIQKTGFTAEEFFLPREELMNRLVARDSENQIKLNGTLTRTADIYESIRVQAGSIDPTLEKHVEALKKNTLYRLQELEKKMLRAEKRKFSDARRQIESVKNELFPGNGLQERVENFMPLYAKWGNEFILELYRHSLAMEQEFVILNER